MLRPADQRWVPPEVHAPIAPIRVLDDLRFAIHTKPDLVDLTVRAPHFLLDELDDLRHT